MSKYAEKPKSGGEWGMNAGSAERHRCDCLEMADMAAARGDAEEEARCRKLAEQWRGHRDRHHREDLRRALNRQVRAQRTY